MQYTEKYNTNQIKLLTFQCAELSGYLKIPGMSHPVMSYWQKPKFQ